MKCNHCGEDNKELLFVYSKGILKSGKVVPRYMCRKCNTERCRRYRQTPEGKKHVYDAVYRSIKKLRYKQRAREILNYNVHSKKIIRPSVCTKCKRKCRIEGHHEDYSKPLEVIWLCRSCHFEVDKLAVKSG